MAEWTEDLAVGFAPVDEQHKELFARVGNMCSAIQDDLSHDVLDQTMEFLETYIVEHFNAEEVYMRSVDYPDLDSHKGEHMDFIKIFNRLKKIYQDDGPSSQFSAGLERTICGWLKNHIQRKDKALATYLTITRHD